MTGRSSSTRRRAGAFLLSLLALVPATGGTAALAQPTTVVKMATLVPDGSVWHKILVDMGDDWKRATQGRVTLRIYPGGVAGDEPDLVRKMRIGQIHASALTVKGLTDIEESFVTFTVPMLFDSYPELFHVLGRMEPTLRKRLEAKGYVLLNWGHAGWVYFFTKQPVRSAGDLKRQKIWVWAGDDKMSTIWKEMGFQVVPLAATDILTGLQTGMIEALPTVPLGALQLQWFRTANHMVDSGLAPLVGGIVITRKVWNRISEADRAAMLAGCRRAEQRLEQLIPEQDRNAIAEMQKRGLQVTQVAPAAAAEWRALTEKFVDRMRGTIIPPDLLEMALRERDAFRAGQKSKP